jgi:type IV pilus assembly protein PilO
MNELIGKILKLKPIAKVGLTVGLMLVVGLIYNVMFYTDLSDQIKGARSTQETLKTERASYEKRKVEYLAYRNELIQLQEEQRELLKALPKKAEIPALLSGIQDQAELAGVEVITLSMDAELPEELYVRIPIRAEVTGGYHAVTKFFKNMSELRRIVNVENLSLSPMRQQGDDGRAAPRIKAKFVAFTFRYPDKPGEGGGT